MTDQKESIENTFLHKLLPDLAHRIERLEAESKSQAEQISYLKGVVGKLSQASFNAISELCFLPYNHSKARQITIEYQEWHKQLTTDFPLEFRK